MPPLLTLEQQKQLASWASQRDVILKTIADKTVERDALTKTNQALAESNTEISNTIQQSIGRLEELDRKEKERGTIISYDVAQLETKKSVLQTEVTHLSVDIAILLDSKKSLSADIESITRVHEAVFARAGEIERIVNNTVQMNSVNAREIVSLLSEAKTQLKEVIDIGNKNVEVTNRAIQEIPKIIVDLHRDVLERRKKPRGLPL